MINKKLYRKFISILQFIKRKMFMKHHRFDFCDVSYYGKIVLRDGTELKWEEYKCLRCDEKVSGTRSMIKEMPRNKKECLITKK